VLGAILSVIGGLVFLMFFGVLVLASGLGSDGDLAGWAAVIGGLVAGAGLGTWGLWLIARGGRRRVMANPDEPNREGDVVRPAHEVR
jgi:hypothetical protein